MSSVIKGTTVIELTDVNTGEVQTIEEHNYFTNAYRDLCQPILRNHDIFQNTLSIYGSQSINFRELTSGLLLFNENLGDNPDNYFPPASVNMVGHGAEITYLGSDLTLGSYNAQQSDLTKSDSSKMVWDFSAEQANGTIASVCLTTRWGGMIGYGTKTPVEVGTTYMRMMSNFHRALGEYEFPTSKTYCSPVYLSFKDDYMLILDFGAIGGTGVLKFMKMHMWTHKSDIFKQHVSITGVTDTDKLYSLFGARTEYEEITLDLSSIIGAYDYYGVAQDGKFLYITQGTSSSLSYVNSAWQINQKISIVKINLETLTYEVIEVTNTTGYELALRCHMKSTYRQFQFAILNNYLFAVSRTTSTGKGKGRVFAINLSDNTDVRQVKDADGNELVAYGTDRSDLFMMNVLGRVCFSYSQDTVNNRVGNYPIRCVSTSDFISKALGTTCHGFIGTSKVGEVSIGDYYQTFPTDNPLYYGYLNTSKIDISHTSKVFHICFFPNVLMTINNLSTPVTKTSSQTMRVTYTISKEEAP